MALVVVGGSHTGQQTGCGRSAHGGSRKHEPDQVAGVATADTVTILMGPLFMPGMPGRSWQRVAGLSVAILLGAFPAGVVAPPVVATDAVGKTSFSAVTPCRLLDTRTVGGRPVSGAVLEVDVVGRCGVSKGGDGGCTSSRAARTARSPWSATASRSGLPGRPPFAAGTWVGPDLCGRDRRSNDRLPDEVAVDGPSGGGAHQGLRSALGRYVGDVGGRARVSA